jgi:hypothetical protein
MHQQINACDGRHKSPDDHRMPKKIYLVIQFFGLER